MFEFIFLQVEKKKIEEIVKKYDVEKQLKENKKICLLSLDITKEEEIKKILKEFKKVEYKGFSEKNNINFNSYDLIFINNNINSTTHMDDINNFIKEKNKEKYFFYYGGQQTERGLKNLNFANSVFQLYGNLINTLRTQDLLNR